MLRPGLIILGLFFAAIPGIAAIMDDSPVIVFRRGEILLAVYVAEKADAEERAAAEELARVLGVMSGLPWRVHSEEGRDKKGIYVGRTQAAAKFGASLKVAPALFDPKPGEVGPDAFRIQSHNGCVFIEGATPEATGFAVGWLLQHEGGVRWYAPGPAGESVPRRTEWSLKQLSEMHQPAYLSREISGLRTADEKAWARHNGLRRRLEFSHALSEVYTRKDLAAHPDWAPLIQGKRFLPLAKNEQNWQPNLALPEVAEQAARAAAAAFSSDPTRASFSLGMNDTVRFDQSAETRRLVEPLRYFRGMPDYSPLVFGFMNRAAESVARTHPDRYLGCLAYFWCENPPSFPLQRNIVPYVTTDRSQYYDHDYREADLALMSRWGQSGVKAYGLWEYAYGLGFLVPRMPLDALADSVREGWQRGARGYMGEVGPQWGFDAFKTWMLAQLLWEPDRSLASLADDFYPGYYGAAAVPMRRFFARGEQQWMTQAGPSFWLKLYYQEDQARLFPVEVCRELRGLLTEAEGAVKTEPVLATRVKQTSRAFAVTEAFVKYDGIRRSLAELKSENIVHPEAVLVGLIKELTQAEAGLRRALAEASAGESPAMSAVDLAVFVRNDPVPRVLWLAGHQDSVAPHRILAATGSAMTGRSSWLVLADILADGKLPAALNLVANGSFINPAKESLEPRFLYPPFGAIPAKWELKAMPTERGKVELLSLDPEKKRRVVRMEGAWDTQLFQWMPVEPDCSYVATARLRGQSGPGNDSAMFLSFLDAAGKVVDPVRMQSLPKGVTSEWRTLVLAALAPDKAVWVGIGIGATRQSPGDWLEVAGVELRGVIKNEIR